MRLTVYVIIVVCSSLVLADVHYVRQQRMPEPAVLSYDINSIDSVLQELERLNSRARNQEALLLIHDALKVHPDNWQLQLIRAEVYMALNRKKLALRDLDAIHEQRPEDTLVLGMRARCLRDLHRPNAALQDIERILALDPDSETGHFLNGTIQYARGTYRDAIDSFTRALEANPKSVSTLYNRALTFAELGTFDRARADMLMFIELTDNEKLKETAVGVLREWQGK